MPDPFIENVRSSPPGFFGMEHFADLDPSPSDDSVEAVMQVPSGLVVRLRRLDWIFFLSLGCLWGVISGLSSPVGAWIGNVHMVFVQVGGMTIILSCLLIHARGPGFLLFLFVRPAGILMTLHVVAALASAVLAGSQMFWDVRYALLAISFSIFFYAYNFHPGALEMMRAGLTAAGLFICVLNLPAIVSAGSGINQGSFRLNTFLNADANAQVGAITSISLVAYVFNLWSTHRFRSMVIIAAVATCILVVYATHSRTGAVAMIAGILVLIFLRLPYWVAVIAALLGIPGYAVFGLLFPRAGDNIMATYGFGEHGRDLSTLSGRTLIWEHVIKDVWLPNMMLGAGPGAVMGTTENGLLYNLAEVGIIGTLPLLILLLLAALSAIFHRRERTMHWAIAIFIAGFLISLTETQLFSFGSPSSLLFLASVAMLVESVTRKPSHDHPRQIMYGNEYLQSELYYPYYSHH